MKIIRLNEKESAENSLGDWVQTARHKNAIECIDALSDKIAQFKDGHRQKRLFQETKEICQDFEHDHSGYISSSTYLSLLLNGFKSTRQENPQYALMLAKNMRVHIKKNIKDDRAKYLKRCYATNLIALSVLSKDRALGVVKSSDRRKPKYFFNYVQRKTLNYQNNRLVKKIKKDIRKNPGDYIDLIQDFVKNGQFGKSDTGDQFVENYVIGIGKKALMERAKGEPIKTNEQFAGKRVDDHYGLVNQIKSKSLGPHTEKKPIYYLACHSIYALECLTMK